MEVSTVIQKTISGVDIYLTLEEAQELRGLLGPLPAITNNVAYPLYTKLGRALDDAREANEQS